MSVTNETDSIRPGEVRFAVDPALGDDARLVFIGHINSAHSRREDCPKNMREARELQAAAVLVIDEAFRAGLADLVSGQWMHVLSWLGEVRRDLALQSPRHASQPRGTFSLRSPVRPNPIGLHLVRIVAIDKESGRIDIDAIDTLDGTAILDLKPFFESVDVPPGADAGSDA